MTDMSLAPVKIRRANTPSEPGTNEAGTNNETLAQPPQLVGSTDSTATNVATTSGQTTENGDETGANNRNESAPQTLPPPRIEGTLMITRGRYLHVILDMLYRPEDTATQKPGFFSFFDANPAPDAYRMTQQRRLRSSELNYFDHPKFGVLAIITPYDLPDSTDQTATTIPLHQNSQ